MAYVNIIIIKWVVQKVFLGRVTVIAGCKHEHLSTCYLSKSLLMCP